MTVYPNAYGHAGPSYVQPVTGRLDEFSMKFWVVVISGAKCQELGPLLAFGGPLSGPLAKTAPFRKAVMFNGQILAEAEPGLIWIDQT